MKKAYITGISGFAGSFLAELLLEKGYEVGGSYISENIQNLDAIEKDLNLDRVNLLEYEQIEKSLHTFLPDIIFHLAALTSPAESFKSPEKVFTNNISAQINLLESVRKSDNSPRVLITSSAEVYGLISEKDLPISEKTELRPGSPYAVSKSAQDY